MGRGDISCLIFLLGFPSSAFQIRRSPRVKHGALPASLLSDKDTVVAELPATSKAEAIEALERQGFLFDAR